MTARWAVLMALCLGLLAGCGKNTVKDEVRDDMRDARADAMSGWDKLGERWVNYRAGADRDTIMVTASEGRFSRIALKCEHSGLELFDVEVTFGDGDKFSPRTRLIFTEDTRSRVIDLPGGQRVIRKVEFRYKNLPRGGRAQLELWGK